MTRDDLPKYEPLLHKIVNKFPKKYREELFNELYIQLYDILERYDETQGSFQTFAYKRLHYHCVDYIKDNQLNSISLDEEVEDYDGEGSDGLTRGDLYQDDYNDFESKYILQDLMDNESINDTNLERFIKSKYEEGMTIENITKTYYPVHHIKDVRAIRNIIFKR